MSYLQPWGETCCQWRSEKPATRGLSFHTLGERRVKLLTLPAGNNCNSRPTSPSDNIAKAKVFATSPEDSGGFRHRAITLRILFCGQLQAEAETAAAIHLRTGRKSRMWVSALSCETDIVIGIAPPKGSVRFRGSTAELSSRGRLH